MNNISTSLGAAFGAILFVGIAYVIYPLFSSFYTDCLSIQEHEVTLAKADALAIMAPYLRDDRYNAIVGANPAALYGKDAVSATDGVYLYRTNGLYKNWRCEVFIENGKVVAVTADVGI